MPTRARSESNAPGSAGNQTPAGSAGNQTPAGSAGNQTPAGSAGNQTDDSAPATAKAEVGAAVHQPATGQSQGFLAGFQIPLPGMGSVDPLRLLWLGGLAALATIEIIEWPVALTLGAGSYIAERLARQDVLQEVRPNVAARS